jgi:hypothetical protein
MSETLLGMVDAMLMESTSPEQIVEIGRMAQEGVQLPMADEDATPPLPDANDFVKGWLLDMAMPKPKEPLHEENPQPTPEPAPIRHARKDTLPAVAPPLTVAEVKAAGDEAKVPTFIFNLPAQQESPAMLKIAEGLTDAMKTFSRAAARPQQPAKVTLEKGAIQVTTPPVTIEKGAVHVNTPPVKIEKGAVHVSNHLPKQPKVKGIERDKDGNMVKPIYEE